MNNLAISYEDAKRPQDALKLDEEAFRLRKEKLSADHPDTLVSMSNLALSYKAVGRLPDALKLYEEVLPLWKAKVGPDHPDTIMSMFNLGVLRRRSQKYEGAEELLLACQAAIASGKLGINPHVRANTTRELTRLYDAWDKSAEAEKWLRQMPEKKRIEYAFERYYAWPLAWGWRRW
jgi:tetratricopeptide (TPR) repeat protein